MIENLATPRGFGELSRPLPTPAAPESTIPYWLSLHSHRSPGLHVGLHDTLAPAKTHVAFELLHLKTMGWRLTDLNAYDQSSFRHYGDSRYNQRTELTDDFPHDEIVNIFTRECDPFTAAIHTSMIEELLILAHDYIDEWRSGARGLLNFESENSNLDYRSLPLDRWITSQSGFISVTMPYEREDTQ